ncbi:hypothetical protein LINPERPRIM_LOCUS31874 [Linum perenne]
MRRTKQFGILVEYTAMEEQLLAVDPKKVCRELGSVPLARIILLLVPLRLIRIVGYLDPSICFPEPSHLIPERDSNPRRRRLFLLGLHHSIDRTLGRILSPSPFNDLDRGTPGRPPTSPENSRTQTPAKLKKGNFSGAIFYLI